MNLVNWENLVLPVLLVFLAIQGDLESLEKRDHQGHQVLKEGLAFQGLQVYLDFLGKEACPDFLGCLASKEKWDLRAH